MGGIANQKKEYELLFSLQASLGSNFTSTLTSAQKATQSLQTNIKNLNATAEDISAFQKKAEALDLNQVKMAKLQAEHDTLQKEINETETPTKKLTNEFNKKQEQIEKLNSAMKAQRDGLDTLGTKLNAAKVDTSNLTEETERYKNELENAIRIQQNFNDLSKLQESNSANIAKTQTQLATAVGVTTAVGATVTATMIAPTMTFNDEMAMVGTMLNGTVDEVSAKMAQLGTEALALSSDLGIDTSQMTDGLYNVISAYGETDEAIKQLEVTAQVARAGGSTVSEALALISTSTKGYGDTSAEAQQKAADLAFQTVKLGQTTFPELASAMSGIIPIASSMKVSQEDLYGAMATLTGVTASSASEVSTQLKGVMQGFLSPSADMTNQIEALGYESGKAMLESLGLQGTLETLKGAVEGDTLALAKLFGSTEAQTAIFAMVGEQAENLTEKTLAMQDATGAATEAFELMNNTDMAKWERAKQTFANIGIIIGQSLIPFVTPLIERFGELATKFSQWASENPELIVTILKISASLAALVIGGLSAKLAFLKVYGVFLSIGKVLTLLQGKAFFNQLLKFGAMAAKFTPMVGIFLAIGAAVYYVATHLEEVRAFIEKTFGSEALAVFDTFVGMIQSIGNAIKMVFSGDIEGARAIIENTFGDGGVAIFEGLIEIINAVSKAIPFMLTNFSNMKDIVFPLLCELAVSLLPIFKEALYAVISVLGALLPAIFPIMETLGEIAKKVLPILLEALSFLAYCIVDLAQLGIPMLIDVLEFLSPLFVACAEVITIVMGGAFLLITAKIENFLQILNGLLDFLTGTFTGNWEQAWQGMVDIFSGIFGMIAGYASNTMNTIINSINAVISGLNKLTIPDWVPVLGGVNINLPLIPQFAKGTNYTPDTFIAGEAGAELITGAAGRKVFTAAQTGQIFTNLEKAQGMMQESQPVAHIVSVLPQLVQLIKEKSTEEQQDPIEISETSIIPRPKEGEGGISLVIYSSPVFHIGNKGESSDIEAMLKEYTEQLKHQIYEELISIQEDQRRRGYD